MKILLKDSTERVQRWRGREKVDAIVACDENFAIIKCKVNVNRYACYGPESVILVQQSQKTEKLYSLPS